MQRLYEREKVAADLLKRENDQILHFSLQSALPEGHTLALNTDFGTLLYIVCEDGNPRLVMQEQFTSTEMSVLMPLLEMFPYYCPYEVMYAGFYSGKVDERSIARCRQRLQDAQEGGVWDQEMRPVRGALSRTRLKLRSFGIDISSILATGYILMVGPGTGPLSGL
jgi:hypothetical protein